MTAYVYGDGCPVCGRTIKRRPGDLAGAPCASCMDKYIPARDRYRLKNARLTDEARAIILANGRTAHDTATG